MTLASLTVAWAWLGLLAVLADITARRKLARSGTEDNPHSGSTPAALAFNITADILCPPAALLACRISYHRATRNAPHHLS